jgi:NADPH2 dehydrogenase
MAAESRLFHPLKLAPRLTLAPLTRYRADDDHVPLIPLVQTYYSQRAASLPGTLLVTEATFISPTAGGYDNVPGIWNSEQAAAWKRVTDAVHAKGGFIFCQLWSLGRVAKPEIAAREGFAVHSSSAVKNPDDPNAPVPKEMTVEEIKARIGEYAAAAKLAVEEAGFDGVEVHGANGYLIDQFLQDTCNKRTDEYGGSVEKRARFALEVVKAVVDAVGAERTAIRLSPWSRFQGMRMEDPIPTFSYLIKELNGLGLAYLHMIRERTELGVTAEEEDIERSLDFAVELWDGPFLVAGGLTPKEARRVVDEQYKDKPVVGVFGRHWISNPDLPFRIREGVELNPYNRSTFFLPKSPVGYIDQPFSKEFEALHGRQQEVLN